MRIFQNQSTLLMTIIAVAFALIGFWAVIAESRALDILPD
tara:strand:+ start:538 stop:657 length:120 start_codon:yes stop_codon:yes gene_type:complete